MRKTIKIGEVGVDSGQLIITDPYNIEDEFLNPDSKGLNDYAHTIYRCENDGLLWQFTYGGKVSYPNKVNPFPGSYEDVIPLYGKTPNELIRSKIFIPTDMDPTPHIPKEEFSYRGICKTTIQNIYGQLYYKMGHPGVAVAFNTGMGDGVYDVYAEVENGRVWKVWVEFD